MKRIGGDIMGISSRRHLFVLFFLSLLSMSFSLQGRMKQAGTQFNRSPQHILEQIRNDARKNLTEKVKQQLLSLDVSELHSNDLDYVAHLSRQYKYLALEEKALSRLAQKNPMNLEVLYRYTCVLLRRNKPDQAAQTVEAMIRLEREHLLTRYSVALVQLANQNPLKTNNDFSELALSERIHLLDLVIAGGGDLLNVTGLKGFRSLVLNVLSGFGLDVAQADIPPAALAVRRRIESESYARIISRIKKITMYLNYAQQAMDEQAWQKASNNLQEAYSAGAVHPSLQGVQLEIFAHKGLTNLALKGIKNLHSLYPEHPSLLASEDRIKNITNNHQLDDNSRIIQ